MTQTLPPAAKNTAAPLGLPALPQLSLAATKPTACNVIVQDSKSEISTVSVYTLCVGTGQLRLSLAYICTNGADLTTQISKFSHSVKEA